MRKTLKKATLQVSKVILLCGIATLANGAVASGYPETPINWVVPYAPGAATDTLARRVASDVGEQLKQSVVVENRPGAGTITAARKLKHASKDGYSVMSADISTLALNPALVKNLDYAQSDFTLISMLARLPLVLVARADLPADNITALIDYAKDHPGDLNYASAGLGSPHHMAMELLLQQAGVTMTHIPYSGTAPSMTDLLAGRVDLMFGSIGSIAPHLRSGKLKALGISSRESFPTLKEVRPLHETDARLAGYEMYAWQGLIAPAGIPNAVREKLNETLKQVLENRTLINDFAKLGLEAKWSTASDFETYVTEQSEIWAKLIQEKDLAQK